MVFICCICNQAPPRVGLCQTSSLNMYTYTCVGWSLLGHNMIFQSMFTDFKHSRMLCLDDIFCDIFVTKVYHCAERFVTSSLNIYTCVWWSLFNLSTLFPDSCSIKQLVCYKGPPRVQRQIIITKWLGMSSHGDRQIFLGNHYPGSMYKIFKFKAAWFKRFYFTLFADRSPV